MPVSGSISTSHTWQPLGNVFLLAVLVPASLDEIGASTADKNTFPNGCHVCEVEIDPETGTTTVVRYTVADDFGRLINPLIVEGQIHGGIVQGIGQVLMENIVYDESGQLLSGSFQDYCMPRADDFCFFELGNNESPTDRNPLGVKGVGEAGTLGAIPAVMNAVNDALARIGAPAIEMPATSEKVWRAIRAASFETRPNGRSSESGLK